MIFIFISMEYDKSTIFENTEIRYGNYKRLDRNRYSSNNNLLILDFFFQNRNKNIFYITVRCKIRIKLLCSPTCSWKYPYRKRMKSFYFLKNELITL